MSTRLSELEIDETSGVENPANELPGWLVVKSKGDDGEIDAEKLNKAVDEAESDFAVLYSALQACAPYLGDAPPEVQDAAASLIAYIEGIFGEDGEAPPPEATAPEPVLASADKSEDEKAPGLLEKLFGRKRDPDPEPEQEPSVSKEKTDDETKPEGEVEKSGEGEPQAEPDAEPTAKSADEQAATIVKAVEQVLEAKLQPITETQDVLKDAVSGLADRVNGIEAAPQAAPADWDLDVPVEKDASREDRGKAALHTALVKVAQGGSVTLGRGT